MPDKVKVDDLVVLIPGILGSVLSRNGDVWKISPQVILSAIKSRGGTIKDLEIKGDGHKASAGGITATALFSDTQIIPFFWKVDGYEKTAAELKKWLTLDDDNYFEFPYDWRLDNRVAANQLAKEVKERLGKLREKRKQDVKVIFLAHSMGGLVARYFIECLGGWNVTRMLITFGTPYKGSLKALGFLMNGYPVKIGPVKIFDFSKAMRSFPSVYQLLPTYDCIDIGDGSMSTLRQSAPRLAANTAVSATEIKDAIAFHDEIASAVEKNDDQAKSNARYEIHPIVGADQPTFLRARLNRRMKVDLYSTYGRYPSQGDTTVPWISAHPDNKMPVQPGTYVMECHGSLQNADDCLTQVRNLIARHSEGAFMIPKAVAPPGISLYIKDLYESGTVAIVAKTRSSSPLNAEIIDLQTGSQIGRAIPLQLGANRRHTAKVPDLRAGAYRVTVSGTSSVRPVTDVFMVV